jgi:HK97 family phage prohead protease
VARAYKRYPVSVRRVEGKQVTALVSVYGNVDLQGDIVVPGAFDASIARWVASGDPIPLIWSHDWGNPLAHVGTIDSASVRSDDRGLTVTAEFKGETEFAQQVQRLVEGRRVTEWSFSYDVIREEEDPDTGANRLVELDLIEAGPTLKGANPETGTLSRGLLSAKSLQDMLAREAGGKAADVAEAERLHAELDRIAQGVGGPAQDPASDGRLVAKLLNELKLAAEELEAKSGAKSFFSDRAPLDREAYEAAASRAGWTDTYEEYLKAAYKEYLEVVWGEFLAAANLADAGRVANWAGSEPPKRAEVFTGRLTAPEFDTRFRVASTGQNAAPVPAGEPETFSGRAPVGPDDSPVRAQITSHGKNSTSTGALQGEVPMAFAILAAVNQLANTVVRAAQGAGLLEDGAALSDAGRALRDVASGLAPQGNVEGIIRSVAPIADRLRAAGDEVAADNLDRTLSQLAAGVAGETISNEDHLRGDVG